MSGRAQREIHTVGEEWLALYAAGGLSPAKRLVIDCQAAMEPELAVRLADLDHVGGDFLEGAEGAPLSQDFLDRLLDRLDGSDGSGAADASADRAPSAARGAGKWTPEPLRRLLSEAGLEIRWRFVAPGLERAPLLEGDGDERLYLLRARPGLDIPEHGHSGEEWTLILQGGYSAEGEAFAAGDLHREDEAGRHGIVIDDDGPCISLVAIEGRLRFEQPLLKLLQPLLGI